MTISRRPSTDRRAGEGERDRGERQRGDARRRPARRPRAQRRRDGRGSKPHHAARSSPWPAIIRPSVPRSTPRPAAPRESRPRVRSPRCGRTSVSSSSRSSEMRRTPAPRLARREQPAVDLGLRADVEAARRLVGEDEARLRGRGRGRGSASGCCRRREAAPAHPAPGSGRRSRGSPPRRAARIAREAEEAAALERRLAQLLERDVLGDRHRADDAVMVAVLGDAGDAGAGEASRVVACDRLAEEPHRRRCRAARARRRAPASAAWPLPETPAMPTISPSRDAQASPPRASCARRRRRRPRRRARGGPRPAARGVRRLAGTSRPTISSAIRRRSASAVAISPTLRPPRSTAMRSRDRQHLAELVRDEDDGEAARGERRGASRTGRRPPAASAPRSARRGRGCGRRGRAPSGSRPAAARRPRAARPGRRDRRRGPNSLHQPPRPSAAPRRSRRLRPEDGSVPSMMLSRPVRFSASVKCWWTMPMPAASAACGDPGGERRELAVRAGDQHRRPRRRRSGRRGCSSASSCRRRSRRAARGFRRAGGRGRCASLATSGPKRLVMPARRRTTGAFASDRAVHARDLAHRAHAARRGAAGVSGRAEVNEGYIVDFGSASLTLTRKSAVLDLLSPWP